MHAFFHTRAAQRRSIWAAEARVRKPEPASAPACTLFCVMQMTVETSSVTALRQMAVRVCGDAMEFMRIEACEHGARMKVWLCVSPSKVAQVMEAVMRFLPGAEFGRFSDVGSLAPAPRRILPRQGAQ